MRKIKPTTKRKIAGIIAIVLIVAMILSAVLPIFFRTAYAGEAQPYDVEARLGLSGAAKQDTPAPVEIKITNNSGKDFKGKVSLSPKRSMYDIDYYSEKSDNSPEYYADIELAAGETKQIRGRIPVSDAINDLKTTLTDNRDKVVYETAQNVVTDKKDSLWLGVLSDSTRTRDNIAANFTEYGNSYGVTRLVELTQDDLEYISSVDLLVINDFDMSTLSDDSLAKIRQRTESGALVIIGDDGDYSEYSQSPWFKALAENAVQNSFNTSDYSETSEDAYQFAVNVIENCSIDDDSKEKMTTFCTFLTDEELYRLVSLIWYYDGCRYETAQAVADEICSVEGGNLPVGAKEAINALYEETKNAFADFKQYDYAEQMMYQAPGSEPYSPDTNFYGVEEAYAVGDGMVCVVPKTELAKSPVKVTFAPQAPSQHNSGSRPQFDLEKPSEILGGLFLAVIMLYAIFIGPFLFLILKKKDRREKAVKYIPLSALCLTAVIIVCSMGSKFQRPLASVVNLVRLGETGLRQTDGYMSVASPTKGKINVKAENITSAIPLSNYSWDGGFEMNGYSASLTEFDYTYKDQTKWSTKKYNFDGSIELNGSIDVRLLSYDSVGSTLQVELTNNTGYDIEDVCASTNGDFYYNDRLLKKLKNGETKTCDIIVSTNYGANNFGILKDASNGYDSMAINKRKAVEWLKNNQLLIVGFINSNTAGAVKVNGRKASKEEVTALYTYINITSEYDYATLGGGTYDTN